MSDHEDMISAVRASVEQLKDEPEKVEAAPDAPEESASERARDEKGRFVASEEKPEQIPVGEAKKQAAPEALEAPVEAPSTAPQLKPPTSWSHEAKTEWSKLSPSLQQAVLKREDEISRGSQQYSDERQRLKMLEGVIAPRRDYYQRFGFKSDAEAINHLFTLSDSMERDAAGTLANLARHYGVDFTQPPQQQQQQPQQTSPNIEAIIEEKIAMRDAKITVQEFESNPPEHYQDVKPLMRVFLESGQAKDLQDAYDKAIWASPDLRSRMLETQRAEEERKRQASVQAKTVKKVQAANASLSGAPHGSTSAPAKGPIMGKFGDVAEDVRAAMASLM